MALGKRQLEELVRIAAWLPEREQLELIARLSAHLANKRPRRARRVTWMEMAGVGAEVWKGIDAQEYVKRERASWHSFEGVRETIEGRPQRSGRPVCRETTA